MRKILLLLTAIVLCAVSSAEAKKTPLAAAFQSEYPPFYTMTFTEVSLLADSDRKLTYLELLARDLREFKQSAAGEFATFNAGTLERLSQQEDSWNKLRADVFYECQKRESSCKRANVRKLADCLVCPKMLHDREAVLDKGSADRAGSSNQ